MLPGLTLVAPVQLSIDHFLFISFISTLFMHPLENQTGVMVRSSNRRKQ